MSTEGMTTQDYIDYFSSLTRDEYVTVAAFAFRAWEMIVTFDLEVDLFWKGSLSGATIIFFLNRYISLAGKTFDLPHFAARMSAKSQVGLLTDCVQYFPWATFSTLRAFALSRNWALSTLVLTFSLVTPAINISKYAFPPGITGSLDFVGNCFESSPLSANTEVACDITDVIVSRACLMAADLLLLLITWFTLPKRAVLAGVNNVGSFSRILLRDGTLYFIVLFTLNALHLIFSITSIFMEADTSELTVFTEPITSILVSRFLIDLQGANRKVLQLSPDDPTHSQTASGSGGTLNFARVVGSIGSFVPSGTVDETETDDEGIAQ